MLKIKTLIAMAAVMVMMLSFAAPAMAEGMTMGDSLREGPYEYEVSFCDWYPKACFLYETPILQLPDPHPDPWLEEDGILGF